MGKGRNKDLIKKRDSKLCARYYYWTEVKRLRFDDALRLLSEEEFFISEERIMTIIRESSKQCGGTDCKTAPAVKVRPVPRVKLPRLSYQQLSLFRTEEVCSAAPLRRDSKI